MVDASKQPAEPAKDMFMGDDNLSAWMNRTSYEPTSMPKHVPPVQELGITSAPMKSASFLMGSYCKEYTEDFMLCRGESQDPAHCLLEGRRVTRCGTDFINQMRQNCGEVFAAHWQCLDRRNQSTLRCRNAEKRLNNCAEEKMGLKKVIPDALGTPIHLRDDKDLYHKSWEA